MYIILCKKINSCFDMCKRTHYLEVCDKIQTVKAVLKFKLC